MTLLVRYILILGLLVQPLTVLEAAACAGACRASAAECCCGMEAGETCGCCAPVQAPAPIPVSHERVFGAMPRVGAIVVFPAVPRRWPTFVDSPPAARAGRAALPLLCVWLT